jgi:hypothetical protein
MGPAIPWAAPHGAIRKRQQPPQCRIVEVGSPEPIRERHLEIRHCVGPRIGGRCCRDGIAKPQRDHALHELPARRVPEQTVASARRDSVRTQGRKQSFGNPVRPFFTGLLAPIRIDAITEVVPHACRRAVELTALSTGTAPEYSSERIAVRRTQDSKRFRIPSRQTGLERAFECSRDVRRPGTEPLPTGRAALQPAAPIFRCRSCARTLLNQAVKLIAVAREKRREPTVQFASPLRRPRRRSLVIDAQPSVLRRLRCPDGTVYGARPR